MNRNNIKIMGILNITPNSFSDGGNFITSNIILKRIFEMINEGADIIDIGAESTAPHNSKISHKKEWKRLEPIIKNLPKNIQYSLDSYKADTWEKTLKYQENIILNDVSGLKLDTEKKIFLLKKYPKTKVIIMFSRDISKPDPKNIMDEIINFFEKKIFLLTKQNIHLNRIIIDSGMGGFLSKNKEISFEVIKNLALLKKFNCEILTGTSRKSFLSNLNNTDNPKNRLISSVLSAIKCMKNGSNILRVHDIKETVEGINIFNKL
jgi:dihydropteroate synthase